MFSDVGTCGLYLLRSLTFGDVLIPDLHSGITQSFEQIGGVQTHEVRDFVGH